MHLRIATRGSELALIQAEQVRSSLSALGISSETVTHTTRGDVDRKSPIYSMNKVGVFVEELNTLVSEGKCDAAVHSAKDIPSQVPDDLEISAVLPRASPNDAFVSNRSLSEIGTGAVIGTSSIRRISSLKIARGDLQVKDIRGNIDTRLKKLDDGEYDGIVIALAALERMKREVNHFVLDTREFPPAPNQGIIAVVTKRGSQISHIMKGINDEPTFGAFQFERELVTGLQLGCSMPVGILCTPSESLYHISATFYSLSSLECRSYESDVRRKEEAGRLVSEIKRTLPGRFGYRFGWKKRS